MLKIPLFIDESDYLLERRSLSLEQVRLYVLLIEKVKNELETVQIEKPLKLLVGEPTMALLCI